MQFYMVHDDPKTSASMLPDYALKQVNLREGWQILSDIGHILGVTFEGQNKLYSTSHALTRSLCIKTNFKTFIIHYISCCIEYLNRYGKSNSFIDKFIKLGEDENNTIERIYDRCFENYYQATIDYLLTCKIQHLTKEDLGRLGRTKNEI